MVKIYTMTDACWYPSSDVIAKANITQFMSEVGIQDLTDFHAWTHHHYQDFWKRIIARLNIVFKTAPTHICDIRDGIRKPHWLSGAKLNIIDSCFRIVNDQPAILYADDHELISISYRELHQQSNRVANNLTKQGYQPGDTIAIIMPMTPMAITFYLGIIKMGGTVVSIADSFSATEIATRLSITKTKLVFTQNAISWEGKIIPLYEKVKNADSKYILSIVTEENWDIFFEGNSDFSSTPCNPESTCNILFSSGTTGTPKAIPWNHTTPIKVASDAFFHQNIKPGDVLAWPTNLGWMMGPWLVFAALLNHATIALYNGSPKNRSFGEFIQRARVTMLGVVPTLVAGWKQTRCMENLDWSAIKLFTSTGECSNADDMAYLMSLGGNKPIIEYCGGTEIGGAYISSTVIQPNHPSTFSTPAMGIDFKIIDETGHTSEIGEVALISPSIGLSTYLLNADHDHIYFDDMPNDNGITLRRHGDQIKKLPNGYYTMLGRIDDTMNLGGIKISAAEIERALVGIPTVKETAAIAITPTNKGPAQLIVFAATSELSVDKNELKVQMQKKINTILNPLFKIHDIVIINELPKTASNKIMRRLLRNHYST